MKKNVHAYLAIFQDFHCDNLGLYYTSYSTPVCLYVPCACPGFQIDDLHWRSSAWGDAWYNVRNLLASQSMQVIQNTQNVSLSALYVLRRPSTSLYLDEQALGRLQLGRIYIA